MKNWTLIQQFSLIFLIVAAAGTAVYGQLLTHLLEEDMMHHTLNEIKDVIHDNALYHFTEDELLEPKMGQEYSKLKERFDHLSFGRDVLGIKIWNRDMILVWSTDGQHVGESFPHNDELATALKGDLVSEIKDSGDLMQKYSTSIQERNLLEIYIPIHFREGEAINIVFEIYQDAAPLFSGFAAYKKTIWTWSTAGVIVAYCVLCSIVWGGSRKIKKQQSALTDTVSSLEEEIVKRTEMEGKLKQASDDWRATFDATQDCIIMLDSNFNVLKINAAGGKLMKTPLPDLTGLSMDTLCSKAGLPSVRSILEASTNEIEREKTELYADDRKTWFAISIDPVLSMETWVLGAVVIMRDITDVKNMEHSLVTATQDWEDTFNTITDMITIHDNEYNIIRANRAAETVLNLDLSEDAANHKCFRQYHGTDKPPEGCPSCNCYNTRKPAVFEVFEPHLQRYVEIRSIPRFNRSSELTGLIHVVRDISQRKKQEDLIQTQLNHLRALSSIDRAITGSVDLHVTLDIFLDQVTERLRLDAASVLLLNHKTHMLEYVNNKGFRSHALKHTRLKLGESHAGKAAMSKSTVMIPNLRECLDGFVKSELFREEDFIAYFGVPLIARGTVQGVLELFHRQPMPADPQWLDFLDSIANMGAIAIDNATMFDNLNRSNTELSLAYDTTIEGWSRAMDLRDRETEGHSQRVTDLTVQIAEAMGFTDEDIVNIRRGALLHDMGKMGIPDSILLKPGKLTEEEWIVMKQHPEFAYQMLHPIAHLRPALDIPYCHHEKWDGTGYPQGLGKEEIPLSARIFAVVDVWDALSSDRPYRGAWPRDKVIEHIKSLNGSHFDPDVVDMFLKMEVRLYQESDHTMEVEPR